MSRVSVSVSLYSPPLYQRVDYRLDCVCWIDKCFSLYRQTSMFKHHLQAAGFSFHSMDPSRLRYGCLFWKTWSGTIYRHGTVYVELINVSAFTGKPERCYLWATRFRVNSMDPSRLRYGCLFWKTCSGTIYSHRINVQNLPAIYLSRIPNSAVQVVIHYCVHCSQEKFVNCIPSIF